MTQIVIFNESRAQWRSVLCKINKIYLDTFFGFVAYDKFCLRCSTDNESVIYSYNPINQKCKSKSENKSSLLFSWFHSLVVVFYESYFLLFRSRFFHYSLHHIRTHNFYVLLLWVATLIVWFFFNLLHHNEQGPSSFEKDHEKIRLIVQKL